MDLASFHYIVLCMVDLRSSTEDNVVRFAFVVTATFSFYEKRVVNYLFIQEKGRRKGGRCRLLQTPNLEGPKNVMK